MNGSYRDRPVQRAFFVDYGIAHELPLPTSTHKRVASYAVCLCFYEAVKCIFQSNAEFDESSIAEYFPHFSNGNVI